MQSRYLVITVPLLVVIYSGFWMVIIRLLNSFFAQVGIYLFIPAIFLMIPKSLRNKQAVISIIFISLLVSYHNSLPVELCISFMLLFYYIFRHNISHENKQNKLRKTLLAIGVNISIFLIIFLIAQNKLISLQSWNISKLIVDVIASTLLILVIVQPYRLLLDEILLRVLKSDRKNKDRN